MSQRFIPSGPRADGLPVALPIAQFAPMARTIPVAKALPVAKFAPVTQTAKPAPLPTALPIARPVALPVARFAAPMPANRNLTNIGTTYPVAARPQVPRKVIPPALPVARRIDDPNNGVNQQMKPAALPVALPVARHAEEGPGPQYVLPTPMWISRWQPSATVPLSKAPWVVAYRWWIAGAVYEGVGKVNKHRIDLMFKPTSHGQHKHWYIVPEELYQEFRELQTSVGQWLHHRLLSGFNGTDWGCRYPNGEL